MMDSGDNNRRSGADSLLLDARKQLFLILHTASMIRVFFFFYSGLDFGSFTVQVLESVVLQVPFCNINYVTVDLVLLFTLN